MRDLHSHTTASDGLLSPSELVGRAAEVGLRTLAVTDHDTVAGTAEAIAAGRELGVEVICGIEISAVTTCGRNIHVLGYFPDPDRSDLAGFQRERQQERHDRAIEILDKLAAVGVVIPPETIFDGLDERCSVGRPHIARALLAGGHVASFRDAFDRYLGPSGPAYVDSPRMTAPEAADLVQARGGVTSVAHPRVDDLDAAIAELHRQGVAAVEVFHPNHTNTDIRRYLGVVDELGMLVTGGSDYHGTDKGEGSDLGSVTLPEEHFARFADALAKA